MTDVSTETSLQVFSNDEFDLKILPDGDSFKVQAPGFARALGFGSARDMLRTVPDEEKGKELTLTPGGQQELWHITESGFYRVLGHRQTSRIKDETLRKTVTRFQDWVYREVLPQLRKTGSYGVEETLQHEIPPGYAEALELAAAQHRQLEAATEKIMELEPKAAQADQYLAAENLINLRSFARDMQQWYESLGKRIRQQDVYDYLNQIGLIIRRPGGLEHNQATAFAIKADYARNYTHVRTLSDLSLETVKVARLTPAGQAYAWAKFYDLVGTRYARDLPKPPAK